MHDEFRGQIARQGITEEAYLKVMDKTEADLHAEFRPSAEKRVKTLLVLSKVADAEGVDVARRRRSTPRSPAAASATPATRSCWATSSPSAAAASSAARSAGVASSRRSSTAGSPTIPSTRRCRTSRMPRRPPSTARGPKPTPRSTPPIPAPSSPTSRRPPADRPSTRSEPEPAHGETQDARPHGHRVLQPRRARLRHLLAPAARADHLPRRRHRGPPRQPGHRPAPVPRVRGPGEGHQPVHQLARRPGDVRPRDLRHHAVPARAGQHDLHRHGGVDGGGPAGGRREGQALRPAEQPDHDPPGFGRVPRQRARRASSR